MSKIQNISIKTKQVLIFLDKISIYLDKISIYLDKISISYKYLDWSRFVSTISIFLDGLDKYLDKNKSRPKNLDFKNLDRDKIKIDLDVMDNLDGFQKLVSTRWTFLISISFGLERRDPQA